MSVNTPAANSRYDREAQNIDQVITEFTEATVSLARVLDAPESVLNEFVDSAKALGELVAETAHDSAEARQQANDNSDEIQSNSDEIQSNSDEIQSNSDEIQSNSDEIEELREHSGKERAELSGRVNEIEELDEGDDCSQERGAGSSEENPYTSDEQNTPLERVCALPESVVEDNLTRNQRRARSVCKKIDEYGKKVPAGIAIPSSRIKRVLTAQEDSTIHRQTVARVADFLKQFGDGDVKIKKTRSGEKTVVFTDELVEAVTGVVTPKEGDPVTQAVV